MTEPTPSQLSGSHAGSRAKIPQNLLAFGVFFVSALLVLHRSLTLGFLGDDNWLITLGLRTWRPEAGTYQYSPPIMAINYIFYHFFQFNPLPYHAFQLLVLVLNGLLVKVLADDLGFDRLTAYVAGFLALFNAVAAEAYFWYSGICTLLMTFTVLGGLICLARYRATASRNWGLGYLAMVLVAPFMESKGVILPLLGYLMDRHLNFPSGHSWKARLFSGWRLHLAAFALVGLQALFRQVTGLKIAVVDVPLAGKIETCTTTLVSTLFHSLSDYLAEWSISLPFLWGFISLLWIPLLAVVALGLLIQGSATGRRRFLMLVSLWVVASLPHSLAATVQYRYFYLPGVFAALVLAALMQSLGARIIPRRAGLVAVLGLAAYLAMDLPGFQRSLNSFLEASRIYDEGIKKIKQELPVFDPGTNLVLVDFPDYISSQQGRGRHRYKKYYIYVYRNAICPELEVYYQTRPLKSRITFLRLAPFGLENPAPLGEPISAEKLREMRSQPQNVVLKYIPGQPPRFVRLGGQADSPGGLQKP